MSTEEYGCHVETKKTVPRESEGSKSWFMRRSKLEKILLLLVFLTCIAFVAVLVALIVMSQTSGDTQHDSCTSIECVKAASTVYQGMDTSVNPCDNFYEFACGGWIKRNVVPDDRSRFAIYGALRDNIQITLKRLLEEDVEKDDIEAVVKSKQLYKSCVNSSQIEGRGINAAIPLLEELGGWPILGDKPGGNWKEEGFSLPVLLKRIRKYNNIPYIYFYVYTDSRNSSKEIIYLDNPGLIMPERKFYLKDRSDPIMMAYENFGANIAMEFGADETRARQDMKEILNIETDLANITLPTEQRRDAEKLYNKFKIKDLKNELSESTQLGFTWLQYFQQIFQLEGINITITEDEEVVVKDVNYFVKLFHVLNKYSKRAVTNYAVWRIMNNRAYNLPERFRQHIGQFNEVLFGSTRLRPRWRTCVTYVVASLGLPAGRLFVEKHFDEEAKLGVKEMISNIRATFLNILNELKWMDEETRNVAKEKVDYIGEKIGYDDEILVDSQLNRRYENITIDPNTYFENVLNILRRSAIDDLKILRYILYRMNWESAPSTVNAYYSSSKNRIMFPAGILQPPYYHKDFPRYLNYGGIGTLIGHEITHGFDDKGRQYDKKGELNEWWNTAAITKFKSLSKCFVNQYGNFSYPEAGGIHVNGIITLGENIADNGGMKQAFRAYRNYIESRGKEELPLPGIDLDGNQLFFVNFAQIRCSIMHKEDAASHVITGPHSPARFRVIGTLQNFPEFSDVYRCPKGSYMNPAKKCNIW